MSPRYTPTIRDCAVCGLQFQGVSKARLCSDRCRNIWRWLRRDTGRRRTEAAALIDQAAELLEDPPRLVRRLRSVRTELYAAGREPTDDLLSTRRMDLWAAMMSS